MSKKKMGKIPFAVMWGTIMTVGVAALVVGNVVANNYSSIISLTLQQATSKIVDNEDAGDTEYFKSEYASDEALYNDGLQLCKDITAEGIVLLKNDNNLLPLGANKKVSLFSESSVDFVYGGSGSGSIDTSTAATLKEAFEDKTQGAGYTVNPTLWDFYTNNHSSYTRATRHVFSSGTFGSWAVNECPYSEYTQEVKNSYAQYNDAAIVIISRMAGEGDDIPCTTGETATMDGSTKSFAKDEGNKHELQLTNEEKSMFEGIQNDDNIKNIIVVINSANPLEAGFLSDGTYSKIHAAMQVASVGQSGLYSLARVFTGDVVPSGKLVDTWAYDLFSSPSSVNMSDHTYVNGSDFGDRNDYHHTAYVAYQEGIYVGYKYYETRYEDKILNQGNAGNYDYNSTIQFPFGYGLSYTTFEYSDFKVVENNDNTYTLSVKVTNNGDTYSGKEAVQFYVQTPYTDYDKANNVEKSSVEMVGFGKTGVIAPKNSEVVSATVSKSDFDSYDYTKAKTYILDDGTYYFTAASNAHEAVNNILAKKGKTTADGMTSKGDATLVSTFSLAFDNTTYSVGENDYKITNQLQDADINNYGISMKYLTRNDWTGSYPTEQKITASKQMIEDEKELTTREAFEAKCKELGLYTDSMPTTNAKNGLTLITMKGADYDDENWESLLDNLSFEEMQEVIRIGGYKTEAISSIAFNGQIEQDGPAGITNTIVNTGTKCMAYPAEAMLGSSFNQELASRLGTLVGEDALHAGKKTADGMKVGGWYAPSMNTHRNPFSGRNFEYYSEDGLEAGILAEVELKSLNQKGLIAFVKHFAFNDMETNRMGIAVWANEQELREACLEPFERAVRNGGAVAIMSSMNRVGETWSGAHVGLMTNILRNEWGFHGRVLSDYNGSAAYSYQSLYGGLIAGNDQMLSTNQALYNIDDLRTSATGVTLMRKATKNILYSIVNGAGMNGISQSSKVVKVTPAWKIWLISLDVVVGLVVAGGIFLVVRRNLKVDKE